MSSANISRQKRNSHLLILFSVYMTPPLHNYYYCTVFYIFYMCKLLLWYHLRTSEFSCFPKYISEEIALTSSPNFFRASPESENGAGSAFLLVVDLLKKKTITFGAVNFKTNILFSLIPKKAVYYSYNGSIYCCQRRSQIKINKQHWLSKCL